MAQWQTPLNIRQEAARKLLDPNARPGPFVTISRQYGCSGLTLGLLLADILNEHTPPGRGWRVYGREILEQLARESNLATELVEDLSIHKPKLLVDFFRAVSSRRIPSGIEVRNRVTAIVRGLAFEGFAIIVGQGSSGATADMDNGLSIRLEAPLEWRIAEIARREGCSLTQARAAISKMEKERQYIRQIYAARFPREPAFDLVYDDSRFSLAQIAQHVVQLMRLKRMA